jgi:hypothetical protein
MIRAASRGAWEFVAGDDWRSAVGVVVALGLTAAVAGLGLPAWWVAPVATLAILYWSVRRAVTRTG